MKAKTYLFGEIEVDPEKVLNFPNGLLGFENDKRFMLIHDAEEKDPSSYTLQSLDDANLAFQVLDPNAVGFHYDLTLADDESALLQNPAQDDVAVMVLVFKPESREQEGIGANIRAPIIVNTKTRVAIQKPMQQLRTSITISNLASAV